VIGDPDIAHAQAVLVRFVISILRRMGNVRGVIMYQSCALAVDIGWVVDVIMGQLES
jgi:hypothetical protein